MNGIYNRTYYFSSLSIQRYLTSLLNDPEYYDPKSMFAATLSKRNYQIYPSRNQLRSWDLKIIAAKMTNCIQVDHVKFKKEQYQLYYPELFSAISESPF